MVYKISIRCPKIALNRSQPSRWTVLSKPTLRSPFDQSSALTRCEADRSTLDHAGDSVPSNPDCVAVLKTGAPVAILFSRISEGKFFSSPGEAHLGVRAPLTRSRVRVALGAGNARFDPPSATHCNALAAEWNTNSTLSDVRPTDTSHGKSVRFAPRSSLLDRDRRSKLRGRRSSASGKELGVRFPVIWQPFLTLDEL